MRGTVENSTPIVRGRLSANGVLYGRISSGGTLVGRISTDTVPYDGGYVVTPTRDTQVLHTASRRMSEDVVVNPIPSNYGLITWDGSVMTVS